METETIEQATARVIQDALSRYAMATLGRDRAIAEGLARMAGDVTAVLADAGLV